MNKLVLSTLSPANKRITLAVFICVFFLLGSSSGASPTIVLSNLKKQQKLFDFQVVNLYSGTTGEIVGVKLRHIPSGAPVFLFQRETVPQVFMWVDTPVTSNQGLPHALEHLLAGKGTTGRYSTLLREMTLSASCAATFWDFNYYCFSSGAGVNAFFEQLHAWLGALYRPDFTDLEAEREFYHFGVVTDPATGKKALLEKGTVYDEMESRQGVYTYYSAANQRVLGSQNPLGFESGGLLDEMRGVTPKDIRRFYKQSYRLGPTTGFIFVVSPKDNTTDFLRRISAELGRYAGPSEKSEIASIGEPKYPIRTDGRDETTIYKFPSANETTQSEVLFSWRPIKNTSITDLKLLQVLLSGLANGQQSLLYKSLVDSTTRELDSGATGVSSSTFLADSPYFAVPRVGVSGVPGDRVSVALINQLRAIVVSKVKQISSYRDGSESLVAFNSTMAKEARAQHRSEVVWTRSPPLFGISGTEARWKDHLEYLEMDQLFVRSLSEESVWLSIVAQLKSRKNIWRDLIEKFHLLDVPIATASAPSTQLIDESVRAKKERIDRETKTLMTQYQTTDEQQALSRFERDEQSKTSKIDEIATKVVHPRFTDHPPLTPDDHIRYRQFELDGVPVVANLFDAPPTIDIDLSFDLAQVPRRYYRLLPLLPRCLDSLGLYRAGRVTSYTDLLAEIKREAYQFSISYPFDIRARRAELTIQASASDQASLRAILISIHRMLRSNYVDLANVDRLRDVIQQNVAANDVYARQADTTWAYDPVFAFRYRDNPLFLAVSSHFTQAHWNERLKWLFHKPVPPAEIDDLGKFANRVLPPLTGLSKTEVSETLGRTDATGLEAELVAYWRKNLTSFPETELAQGFQQLTVEVQEDLRTGPEKTLADLRDLQRLVMNRRALRIDLTVTKPTLNQLQPDLIRFVKSLPLDGVDSQRNSSVANNHIGSMSPSLVAWQDKSHPDFPLYLGLVNPDLDYGDEIFFSDFPSYSDTDHKSLVQILSSNLLSGAGPQGLFMKTWEAGLAYSNGIASDPDTGLLQYYADRSPDPSALVEFVNATTRKIDRLPDDNLVDYALSRVFSFSREMRSPSERGRLLAQDIRDGVQAEEVKRFSEAVLRLRHEPDLPSELKQAGFTSICGVLLTEDCKQQQGKAQSLFFFIGSEKLLTDVEKRLSISGLRRLYPRDYWRE